MYLTARTAEISFGPSRILFAAIVALHGMAAFALFLTAASPALKIALCIALLASLLHESHGMAERTPRHLSIDDRVEPRFVISAAEGQRTGVRLCSPVVLLAWLVVLNFRDYSGRTIPVVLLPDCTDPDEFRRFRVFLNLNGSSLFSQSGEE
jgi:hypothetical protein